MKAFINDDTKNILDRHHFTVIDNAACGIALVDKDKKFLYTNKQFADTCEYSPIELVGRSFQDITHPDDSSEDASMAQALLDGEIDSYNMTKRYITKTGKTVWVKLKVYGLYTTQKLCDGRGNKSCMGERVLEVFMPQILEVTDPEVRLELNKLHGAMGEYKKELDMILEARKQQAERIEKMAAFIVKYWKAILIILAALVAVAGGQGIEVVYKALMSFK